MDHFPCWPSAFLFTVIVNIYLCVISISGIYKQKIRGMKTKEVLEGEKDGWMEVIEID
jgi:hypothetical protein